jgi:hypothetical protein
MKRLGQPFPGADKRSAYLGLFLRQSHPALGLVDRTPVEQLVYNQLLKN